MEHCANGRPLLEIPLENADGPCPKCQWHIQPSSFGFLEEGPAPPGAQQVPILVCGGCYVPLKMVARGKYQALSKREVKKLPAVTKNFLERNTEMHKAIKSRMPH